jgi:hypothetical protein
VVNEKYTTHMCIFHAKVPAALAGVALTAAAAQVTGLPGQSGEQYGAQHTAHSTTQQQK